MVQQRGLLSYCNCSRATSLRLVVECMEPLQSPQRILSDHRASIARSYRTVVTDESFGLPRRTHSCAPALQGSLAPAPSRTSPARRRHLLTASSFLQNRAKQYYVSALARVSADAMLRLQCRLKYCTSRSCFSAAARVRKVPRLRRFPVFGSTLREYNRYSPDLSLRIIANLIV